MPDEKWNMITYLAFGEMVLSSALENGVCRACGSMAYYDKVRKAITQALVN